DVNPVSRCDDPRSGCRGSRYRPPPATRGVVPWPTRISTVGEPRTTISWLGGTGRKRPPEGVPATSRGGNMNLVPHSVRPLVWVALALAVTVVVAACGGQPSGNQPQSFKGTKKVGYSAPLTMQPDIVKPYWVSIVPNTYMEGTAAGRLAAKLNVGKIFIVSPKYLFGVSETNAFVAALKKANSSAQIVNDPSTWYVPFPTNPRWDSTINAIQAAKPNLVY